MLNVNSPSKLSDVIDIKHGFAFSSEFFSEAGSHVLLTPGNFREEGGFRRLGEKQKFYEGPVPADYVLSAGQMLIAMTEQAPGLLGATLIVPEGLRYLHNQRLGLVTVKDQSQVMIKYLHYFFALPDVRKQISVESAGTKVKHTSPDKILGLQAYFPKLTEQIKIVQILEKWDEAIEKLEALRADKEGRFKSVAQMFLAPSRAFGRHIPRSNWSPTSFAEVFSERQDRNSDLGPDEVITVGKYAIRKQSEHFNRSVASKDLSNYWVISPRDFVYDPMSAYYGALGRYDADGDGLVSPAYRVLRLHQSVNSDFMTHLLKSHHIRFLLETLSSQGNKEGKRRLLSREAFSSIEVNLPPIKEQEKISIALASFMDDIKLTCAQVDALTRQKRGLMQKLLTGEWRVKI